MSNDIFFESPNRDMNNSPNGNYWSIKMDDKGYFYIK